MHQDTENGFCVSTGIGMKAFLTLHINHDGHAESDFRCSSAQIYDLRFNSFLCSIGLGQICYDAMALNLHLPVIPRRSGWRGIEQGHDGSVDG